MIKRSATLLLEIVGTLVAGLAIAGGGLAWRLSQGPMSLDFLTPYVEQVLDSSGHGLLVKLDRTALVWSGWTRPIDLHVIGVHVLDAQGHPLATLPEVAMGFSVRALAHGVLAPTSLEVFGGLVHLRRGAEGSVNLEISGKAVEQGAPNMVPLLIDDLLQHADPSRPFSYLREITITDADLVIDDSHWDTSWKARLNHLTFDRDPSGIEANASLTLVVEGVESGVTATGLYDADARDASLELAFDKLEPAAFTHLAPELAPLARVALPLSGRIDVKLGSGRTLDRVDFEVAGGEGHITLPEFYAQDVAVKHLDAKGTLTDHGTKLTLDGATLDLGALKPGGPEGPVITFTGGAQGLGGDSSATLEVTARNFAVDEVPTRWPASIAPHAHAWIAHNLSGGAITELHASVAASGSGVDLQKIALDKLSGTMRVEGINVHYLGEMPSVQNVDGTVQFDRKTMTIALDRGAVEGLTLDQGNVIITGLDIKDQGINIEFVVRGPLAGALRLIDYPPLGYASSLGFDPNTVKGEAATRVKLEFPLIHDLTFAQVEVAAASNLQDVTLARIFLGRDLTDGVLKLRINKEGMSVAGTAALEKTPITLAWDESFGKGKDGRGPTRRIEVKGTADDALRADLALIPEEIVTVAGPVATHMVLTRNGGLGHATEVALDFDLKDATLALPHFVWQKKPGVDAVAHMDLDLKGDRLSAIRNLRITGGGIATHAELAFDDAGVLNAATVPELAFDRTHASGTLARGADGVYRIDIKGDEFDAAGFLKGGKDKNPNQPGPKLGIALNVGKLWLSDTAKMPLGQAAGTLDDDGVRIAHASVAAKTASGAAVNFQIEATPKGRTLNFASDDAGEAMKILGVLDNMVGGKLKMGGTFDDRNPAAPLAGNFRIDDYRLNNAPFMAKLLTLTSLTGILSELNGRGIAFSSMVGSFVKTRGQVKISDGRTAGSELGLTFEGDVDLDADMLNVNGTVVPIYTLNSLLGNIPVLGDILVGPKGGGVFAATYRVTGSLDNPDVSVNPLSALAPGILRGLLGIFSGGTPPPPPPQAVPAPQQPLAPQNAPVPQSPPVPQAAPVPQNAPTSQSLPAQGNAPTQGGK